MKKIRTGIEVVRGQEIEITRWMHNGNIIQVGYVHDEFIVMVNDNEPRKIFDPFDVIFYVLRAIHII